MSLRRTRLSPRHAALGALGALSLIAAPASAGAQPQVPSLGAQNSGTQNSGAPNSGATAGQAAPLAFQVREGRNLNAFYRKGPVAAHVVLRSGEQPRLLVAFPAGNSGVGLWFEPIRPGATWTLDEPPQPAVETDHRGRTLRGVSFEAGLRTPELAVRQAVLSSVRVLRDFESLGRAPDTVLVPPTIGPRSLAWSRDRLDGAAGYALSLEVVDGSVHGQRILAGPDGRIRLRVTALTGETPLTPIAGPALLNNEAGEDPAARRALEFLSYREKFLAGSWRFDTYFGRDTLMSVRLLMPALQPAAVESGLRSVLIRLSASGEVAHEEDIGEFAVLEHKARGEGPSDTPLFNYRMIDGDFMLAPVAETWLLDDPRGRSRARAFLAVRDGLTAADRRPLGADLVANLRYVAERASAFAREPSVEHLIALKPGTETGEWRDSADGLGGGRIPFDVNAVLTPAALQAGDRLVRSGLLDPYLTPKDRAAFQQLSAMAAVWRLRAPPFFAVAVSAAQARRDVTASAVAAGVPAEPALQSLPDGPLVFDALSLDAEGRPIPVENSDESFALLFARPTPAELKTEVDVLARPFPAGLMTDVGLLVANPAFAPPALQPRFSRNAYHGEVVWSWQQALAAAGIAHQLKRQDLPPEVRADLTAAQARLWRAIDATAAFRASELWSWSYGPGGYRVSPFGASGADADESNAAQLWSTVYLALHAPEPHRP